MEPASTSAMISAVTAYLAKKLEEDKSVKSFFSEFTEATVNWLRPIFLIDDEKPKEVLQDLQAQPGEKLNHDAVAIAIAKALKAQPSYAQQLKALYAQLEAKKKVGEAISLSHSKNVNTGSISASGNVIIGDGNKVNDK